MEPLFQDVTASEVVLAQSSATQVRDSYQRATKTKQPTVSLLIGDGNEPVKVPVNVLKILDYVVANMAAGKTLTLTPLDRRVLNRSTNYFDDGVSDEERDKLLNELAMYTQQMNQE